MGNVSIGRAKVVNISGGSGGGSPVIIGGGAVLAVAAVIAVYVFWKIAEMIVMGLVGVLALTGAGTVAWAWMRFRARASAPPAAVPYALQPQAVAYRAAGEIAPAPVIDYDLLAQAVERQARKHG